MGMESRVSSWHMEANRKGSFTGLMPDQLEFNLCVILLSSVYVSFVFTSALA